MELRWNRLRRLHWAVLAVAGLLVLAGAWWLLKGRQPGLLQRDRLLELRRPGAWAEVVRTPKGIASPYGEMSGLASSKVHRGVVWGIRDSGNPATLYALTSSSDSGTFAVAEFPVREASNRDWEDLVYGEDASGTFLLIVDAGAKVIYRVAEPDPSAPGPAALLSRYRFDFPDAGQRSCGPSDNVEAAFLYPAVTGQLHLVRKEKAPARVYRFGTLSTSGVNVPQQVGTLDDSCISVSAVTLDSTTMVTASHSSLRMRQATGGLAPLLGARPLLTARIAPDNNEGGDFYPFATDEILIGAENRTTWRFRHEK